jgi:phosphomannomutase
VVYGQPQPAMYNGYKAYGSAGGQLDGNAAS